MIEYLFIYNISDKRLILFREMPFSISLSSSQRKAECTIEEFVKFAEVNFIDYSILVEEGFVSEELPTDESLSVQISDDGDGNNRKAFILSTPIDYASKEAAMKTVVVTYDTGGNEILRERYYRKINSDSQLEIDGHLINEFNYLMNLSETIGLTETSRQVILKNDNDGVFDN